MYVDIADKVTEDLIKQDTGNIVDRVGVTNNTGATVSSGTLMGKSNKIISDLGTANSNINTLTTNIGSTSASGGTTTSGSVMAKLNKIVGNTNTLVQGVSVVKRVLRGSCSSDVTSVTFGSGITINPDKVLIFIDNQVIGFGVGDYGGTTGTTGYVYGALVESITSTGFTFTRNYVTSHTTRYYKINWQLIEFY